LQKRIKAKNL